MALMAPLELLPDTEEVRRAASYYVRERLMPRELLGDAMHFAFASYWHVEYLLTWNRKHLANPNKLWQMQMVNGRLGLPTPRVVTPASMLAMERGYEP